MPTTCMINGWFSATYENSRGFSIRFIFAKLGIKHATNHTQNRYSPYKKNYENIIYNSADFFDDSKLFF